MEENDLFYIYTLYILPLHTKKEMPKRGKSILIIKIKFSRKY